MSQRKFDLAAIAESESIPEPTLAYIEQRVRNGYYNLVLTAFREEQARSGLTKAKLAKRINRGQDRVGHLLANPANWTIGTVARLLAGISGLEPVYETTSFRGRPAQNHRVIDLLEEAESTIYRADLDSETPAKGIGDYSEITTTEGTADLERAPA